MLIHLWITYDCLCGSSRAEKHYRDRNRAPKLNAFIEKVCWPGLDHSQLSQQKGKSTSSPYVPAHNTTGKTSCLPPANHKGTGKCNIYHLPRSGEELETLGTLWQLQGDRAAHKVDSKLRAKGPKVWNVMLWAMEHWQGKGPAPWSESVLGTAGNWWEWSILAQRTAGQKREEDLKRDTMTPALDTLTGDWVIAHSQGSRIMTANIYTITSCVPGTILTI